MRRWACVLVVVVTGCGARSTLRDLGAGAGGAHQGGGAPQHGGGGSPQQGTGGVQQMPQDGGPEAALPDGPPVTDPWTAALAGYWMQEGIGNCIDLEDWYAFASPPAFVHTQVNRDSCGPHSVRPDPGSFSSASRVLTLDWATPTGQEHRSFSAVVLDPYPMPPPPPHPGYLPGKRALNVTGYHRGSQPLVWHRESDSKSTQAMPPASYETALRIDLSLDVPLSPTGAPVGCTMTLAFDVTVIPDPSGMAASATETFKLPCTYGPTQTSPWIRLTANGFETSDLDSTWTDFLTQRGIEAKYTGGILTQFEEFRPVFYFDPADPADLFHDFAMPWFFEMASPPPAHVD